ncbi:MAG: DUF3298 and DUF4163 domain-containing protein [Odoribacteraceae bacterium]|nr:DUF3298 and DUF4163 domain-containing protein [Odoribacteraceae bacterium]
MKTKQLQPWFMLLLLAGACAQPKEEALTVNPVELTASKDGLALRFARSNISSVDPALNAQCVMFNDHVNKFVTELKDSCFGELPAPAGGDSLVDAGEGEPSYEFSVSDTVFRATSHYISLRVTIYAYTGGAHGNTYIYAFNYDLRGRKFLEKEQLLDLGRKQEIEKLLQARFDNKDGAFTSLPTLDDPAVYNFTAEALHVTYPHYALGPYSSGIAEVSVPLTELKKAFKLQL